MKDGIYILLMLVLLWMVYTTKRDLDHLVRETAKQHEEQLQKACDDLHQKLDESVFEILGGISDTQNAVARLDYTYGALLAAQKRRTLDSLYEEDFIPLTLNEAKKAFNAENYLRAKALYDEVVHAQKDNQDAQFYSAYALFLANKNERNNYRAVSDAFAVLEHSGYTRSEIAETLDYINRERLLSVEEQ
jgi:hypothetical protein